MITLKSLLEAKAMMDTEMVRTMVINPRAVLDIKVAMLLAEHNLNPVYFDSLFAPCRAWFTNLEAK